MVSVYEVAGFEGNWYTDTVAFVGKPVANFTMGVADTFSNGTTNTFGVSYAFPQEFTLGTANPSPDNSLQQMAKAGLIPSSTYSIWMDRNSALGGTVLLGGVDTSKFTGQLQSYPIVPTDPTTNTYVRLALNFTASVGGSKPITGNSSEFPATATLDTGNPNMLLPTNLVASIYSTFGVQPLAIGGASFGVCACGLANSTATLDISFPGLKISIPFSDLVINPTAELYAGFNIPPSIRLPNGTCLFMVSPTRPGFGNIIGDNFLRYAYYVVDLDSHQIGIAASNPKPGKSNIMEIAARASALPSATGAAVSSTETGTTTTGGGGSSPTSSGQPSTTTKASSGSRLSGMSLSVIIGVLGLVFTL